MEKQRILITAKTYPTLSRKYGETVCTAGVREDGSWVRMYPVPFRRLEEAEKTKKFDWVACRLVRNTSDPRPETYRPVDEAELRPVDHVGTSGEWRGGGGDGGRPMTAIPRRWTRPGPPPSLLAPSLLAPGVATSGLENRSDTPEESSRRVWSHHARPKPSRRGPELARGGPEPSGQAVRWLAQRPRIGTPWPRTAGPYGPMVRDVAPNRPAEGPTRAGPGSSRREEATNRPKCAEGAIQRSGRGLVVAPARDEPAPCGRGGADGCGDGLWAVRIGAGCAMGGPPGGLMDDREFCIAMLPKVSRTFALSIEALPEPLRSTVRVSYLLCRIVDTVEDDAELPWARRVSLFEEFERLVSDDAAPPEGFEAAFAGSAETADNELCRGAGAAFRDFRRLPRHLAEAARPHVLEMARGMREYAERWERREGLAVLRDVPDLERYCYFVAGTVGNLLTSVFVAVEEGLDEATRRGLVGRSVAFGLGLQMTNIVKDVTADRERGWCFLPASLCADHGLEPEELLDPARREEAMAVVRDVAELASRRLDEALEYTLLLPRDAADVRLFVLVPLALAIATLALVRRSPAVLDPAAPKVKVSRATVATVLSEARGSIADDEAIRRLCARAASFEIS